MSSAAVRVRPACLGKVSSAGLRLFAALSLIVTWLVVAPAPSAQAAGSISLDKSSSGTALFGGEARFTLTATNSGVEQYNLSFRDILPPGVTYQRNSTSPAGAGEPQVIEIPADPGAVPPTAAYQILVWSNISDLTTGSSQSLSYSVDVDPAVHGIGDSFDNQADVWSSSDPREVPTFDDDGEPVAGTQVVTDADTASTTVTAIRIGKGSAGTPEGELLRGVHDHQSVYTLTVTNNLVGSTSGITVTDYLPAGLEFLGCGGPFNSDTPEYSGASNTVDPVDDCLQPSTVETVQDPAGVGTGVFTKVTWVLPDGLDLGDTYEIHYAAGIPQRSNTMTFTGGTPDADSGEQAANLDNNTGASTRETADEIGLTNHARVDATYVGTPANPADLDVSDTTRHSVTAEDLRLLKSVTPTEFQQGDVATYTLRIDTSEYADLSELVITDVIPSGMCPLGVPDGVDGTGLAECDGVTGHAPVGATITGLRNLGNETFEITMIPDVDALAANRTLTITYDALMRSFFDADSSPTSALDEFTNHAEVTGSSTPNPDVAAPDTGAVEITDESSATITSGGPQLVKLRMKNDTPMTCSEDIDDYAREFSAEPAFSEGDRICFWLQVSFPAGVDTRNAQLTDFLPPNVIFEAATVQTRSVAYTQTVSDTGNYVQWLLGTGDRPRVAPRGSVFNVVVSGIVAKPVPVTANPSATLKDNLAKLRYTNTTGQSASLRDAVPVPLGPPPPIGITKGVQAINSTVVDDGEPGNVDGSLVRGTDLVTFRIDPQNLAEDGAVNGEAILGPDIWDVLPAGITCSAISDVSHEGKCYDAGHEDRPNVRGNATASVIRWQLPDDYTIEPEQYGETLTYTMAVPAVISIRAELVNTAAVAAYTTLVNTGVASTVEHNPADNINADVLPAAQDVPAASDPSSVRVPDAGLTKTNVTDIVETGNGTNPNGVNQAVVGEGITYTIGVTIPAHTTVFRGLLTDPMPGNITFQSATAGFSADGTSPATGALPAGVSLTTTNGNLSFGTTYTNDTDSDQLFEVRIRAVVATSAGAAHNSGRTNNATFTAYPVVTGGTAFSQSRASVVTILTPTIDVDKTASPAVVTGGSTVSYTLRIRNGNGRPLLHDAVVVDCLPGNLTFGSFGTFPGTTTGSTAPGDGSNGCAAGFTRIQWNVGTVRGNNAFVTLTYTATVTDIPAGSARYTNVAGATGSTLPNGVNDATIERVITDTDNAYVDVSGAGMTKTVSPGTATIGQEVTYTATASLPAKVAFWNAAIVDTLPAGVSYVADSATVSCTPGCTVPGTAFVPGPGEIGWLAGDLAVADVARTITVTYRAIVTDTEANVAGRAPVNSAQFRWNLTGTPPATGWDTGSVIATAPFQEVEPDLTITKAVTDTTPEPGQVFTYTVTVANNGTTRSPLSPAHNVTVVDTVPVGVVVDPASITGAGVLTGAGPNGGGTITWTVVGPIAVNASAEFTYSASLAASETLTSATGLVNTADVTGYESLPSGGRVYDGPSSPVTVTPQFPRVVPSKAAAPGPAYLGQPKTWTVTLTNTGGATAHDVDATDTLPVNWRYDEDSARVSIAGGSADPIEPAIDSDDGGRQVLNWVNLGDIPATGANPTIVITFTATPLDPEAVTDPGVGADVNHTNTVGAVARDNTGATGNASGPYAGPDASASTQIHSADVQITKTSGDAVAGQNLTYTLTVSNNGDDPAVGPFQVVDTLPPGLGAVSWSGTGWSCSLATTTLTCARTNPADTLAADASFPPITVTAAIPADTADGAPLTNSASVDSSTYDPDEENNTDEVIDTVDRVADLGIVKAGGVITAGGNATYTLDVTNHGPSDSAGPIVVTDSLPAATTYVSATGTGWSCDASGHTLTCTRESGLTNGQAAPQLTVVVHVPSGTTGDLTNTGSVDGPETDPNPDNDSSSVTDPVRTSADLAITKNHVGALTPGDEGVYEFIVTNHGPSDAAAPVRVTDQLADELSFVSDNSDDWACSADASNLLTCTHTGSLAADQSRTFRITVAIDPAHTGDITNSATVTSPTDDPHPGNNTDDDSTGVDVRADLGIEKSHTGTAVAGESLDFTLAVTNHGKSDSPGPITVTDTIPVGMSYVSASGSGWSCSADGREVTCTRASGLGAGAAAPDITLRVLVAPDAGPAILTNRGSVSGPATDPNPDNDTDSDEVKVVDRANVRIAKGVSPATVDAGAQVIWTLTVTNDGPSDADNVQISDSLPPGLQYVSIDAPAGVTCADANPVDCRVATMPVDASHEIRVHALVGSGVADDTTITNTATVSTSTPGDDPDDNSDSAAITVTTSADLSIEKSHADSPVVAGQPVTFDLDVHNAGPSDAAADVVVTDTLPVGLTYVSSAGAGWSCSAGPVSSTGQLVTCTLTGGAAVLAGTDAPALAITAQVDSDLDPASLDEGILTNTATVSSPTEDPDPDNNTDTDPVSPTTSADLAIVKSHLGPARIGDQLEFTLDVANHGPSTARQVTVSDELPAGLEYVSVAGVGWSCSFDEPELTCAADADLAAGESAEPIVVTVTVLAAAYPGVTNIATVDSATEDPNPDDNSSSDPVTVPPQVDLGITKSHEPEPLQVGDQATYTLWVSNAGATDDPGPITVTDTLPDGLSYVSGSGDGWVCSVAVVEPAETQVVTCTREAGLEATGNTSIALVVAVGPEAYSAVTNTAEVSSPAEDTNPLNNVASDPATVLPLYDLAIAKELDRITGSDADWTITVTNNGPNEAPGGALVTDDLPGDLTYVDFTGDGWTCAAVGQLVTCSYDQAIAAGESVSFVLHTSIDPDASGTITNFAGVVGGNTDSATGRIPSDVGNLAHTGGIAAGVGLLGLLAVLAGALLIGRRRRVAG